MNDSIRKQWFLLSAVWTCIVLLPLGRAAWVGTFQQDVAFYGFVWIAGIAIYPFQLFWFYRRGSGWAGIIMLQILIGAGIAVIHQYFSTVELTVAPRGVVLNGGDWQGIEESGLMRFISGDTYSVFYLYFIQAGMALLLVYNFELRKKEKDEAALKIKLAISQLNALQSELQPHFIFNTLHVVSSLMEENVGKAQLLLEKFSFLLRHYLSIINRQTYRFDEEIDFLSEYADIHRIRSGSVSLSFDVNPECLSVQVPVVLLQPVLENSVKHGWTDRQKAFRISISGSIKDERLRIRIRDNGKSLASQNPEGVGLRNLRDRLNAWYDRDHSFNYYPTAEGFVTELVIPLDLKKTGSL